MGSKFPQEPASRPRPRPRPLPVCGVSGCKNLARHVVSVFDIGPGGELRHDMDSYACEEHARRRGVLKIGELVV
jgi:hypothetical protein